MLKNLAKFSVVTKIDSANIFGDFEQFKNCISGLCLNALEAINKENAEISIFVSDTILDPLPFQKSLQLKQDEKFQDVPKLVSNNNDNFIFCGCLKEQPKYIRLSVNDNGAGISSDAMPNIFDPFFSSKPDGSSVGMGLSSIKGIVLSYKGAIVVESVLGKGTSTHIFVPMVEDSSLNVGNTQFNQYIN